MKRLRTVLALTLWLICALALYATPLEGKGGRAAYPYPGPYPGPTRRVPYPGPIAYLPFISKPIAWPTETPTPTPTATVPVQGWVTLFDDGFEAGWPPYRSRLVSTGNYGWGATTCKKLEGAHGAWVLGSLNGAPAQCGASYPNDLRAALVIGPLDLRGATAGQLTFESWSDTQEVVDTCFWGVTADGINSDYGGRVLSGDHDTWVQRGIDLADVPYKGNVLGQSEVYVAFIFESDWTSTRPYGWVIDDIRVRLYRNVPLAPPAGGAWLDMATEGAEALRRLPVAQE